MEQMNIFDFLAPPENHQKCKCGEWVENHGKRVMFGNIKPDHYYIADYSTCSHKWFKVVYVIKITEYEELCYVDDERGVKKHEWSWGNSWSCMTRKCYVDGDERPEAGEAESSGWWYEVDNGRQNKIRDTASQLQA